MVHRMKKKKAGGFTLIELIVVIAILGILAAIVAPRLLGFRQTAEIAADEALKETANKALMLLYSTDEPVPADGQTIAQVLQFLEDKNMVEDDAKFFTPANYTYVPGTNNANVEQGTAIREVTPTPTT